MENRNLLHEARKMLHLAVNFDSHFNFVQAIDNYERGSELLEKYYGNLLYF